mgnify:FL=1|jgi:hypothetical protein
MIKPENEKLILKNNKKYKVKDIFKILAQGLHYS